MGLPDQWHVTIWRWASVDLRLASSDSWAVISDSRIRMIGLDAVTINSRHPQNACSWASFIPECVSVCAYIWVDWPLLFHFKWNLNMSQSEENDESMGVGYGERKTAIPVLSFHDNACSRGLPPVPNNSLTTPPPAMHLTNSRRCSIPAVKAYVCVQCSRANLICKRTVGWIAVKTTTWDAIQISWNPHTKY